MEQSGKLSVSVPMSLPWFSALASVRSLAEQGRDDIAAAVCDAVEMSILPDYANQKF